MKSRPLTAASALASLTDYLQNLQESGVDGIPAGLGLTGAGDEAPAATTVRPAETAVPAPAAAPQPERQESLEKVRKALGDCHRCKLGAGRTNLVFGVGNPKARLVFVGEGPGADEDRLGEPFVGKAGGVLTRLINAMGLTRDEVYICNIVKCRPPGNRDPEADEIEACHPFLMRQIRAIGPEVIVALGKPASNTLLNAREPISRLRGKFHDFHGIPLMPTYHPSFLMRRQEEGSMEPFWEVWDDMTQVLRMLKLPIPEKSRKK